MSSLENSNFANHRGKCRCCLRGFGKKDDLKIKVTEIVQNRFLELTQHKLKISDDYSNLICERCYNEIHSFSLWRKEMLNKQLSLYEFEEDLRALRAGGRRNSGDRDTSNTELHVSTEHDDGTDECVEIKIEPEEFDDGTAVNEQFSKLRAPEKSQSRKRLHNQDGHVLHKPATSIPNELEMNLADGLEDHPKEPEPLKRGTPAKRQKLNSKGKPVMPEGKKIICNVCEKTFSTNQCLKAHHDAVHLKIKRFECDICGRKMHKKFNILEHISRHIEGKPLKLPSNDWRCYDRSRPCPCKHEGCGKYFKTNSDLQHHSIFHSNARPHVCHCGKSYKHANHLRTHQKNVHTEQ